MSDASNVAQLRRESLRCVQIPRPATPGEPHQRQHGPAAKAPMKLPTGAPPPAARTSVLSAISYVDSLLKMIASLAYPRPPGWTVWAVGITQADIVT